MCIYILVGLFLYMMSAPVHGYLGAYFGMQGRSVQGWHCYPSNTCGMLFLVSNVFCMYNAVGCTQSRSAWWLVRSVVPTLVDVMSKKVACLHQGCCANLIQYIKSRVWYQEYTTIYSSSVGCLLCSWWLIASMFRRDPSAVSSTSPRNNRNLFIRNQLYTSYYWYAEDFAKKHVKNILYIVPACSTKLTRKVKICLLSGNSFYNNHLKLIHWDCEGTWWQPGSKLKINSFKTEKHMKEHTG